MFVALGAQHAMRMRHIVICGLSSLYNIFFTLPKKGTIFGKKATEHKMCVLLPLQLLPETFRILRRIERDLMENVYRSSCKVPVIIVRL